MLASYLRDLWPKYYNKIMLHFSLALLTVQFCSYRCLIIINYQVLSDHKCELPQLWFIHLCLDTYKVGEIHGNLVTFPNLWWAWKIDCFGKMTSTVDNQSWSGRFFSCIVWWTGLSFNYFYVLIFRLLCLVSFSTCFLEQNAGCGLDACGLHWAVSSNSLTPRQDQRPIV